MGGDLALFGGDAGSPPVGGISSSWVGGQWNGRQIGDEGELLMGKRHVFSGSMWLCLPTTGAALSAPQCETDEFSVDVVICKHR